MGVELGARRARRARRLDLARDEARIDARDDEEVLDRLITRGRAATTAEDLLR